MSLTAWGEGDGWGQAAWFHVYKVQNQGQTVVVFVGKGRRETFGGAENVLCLDLDSVYRVCLLR